MIFSEEYPNVKLQRKFFKSYTYKAIIDNKVYYILRLPVTNNSILTINSKYIWEIKYGKPDGARFSSTSSKLINLSKFQSLDNKLIIFKGKPYKMYKHINESDVVDISKTKELFGIRIFETI